MHCRHLVTTSTGPVFSFFFIGSSPVTVRSSPQSTNLTLFYQLTLRSHHFHLSDRQDLTKQTKRPIKTKQIQSLFVLPCPRPTFGCQTYNVTWANARRLKSYCVLLWLPSCATYALCAAWSGFQSLFWLRNAQLPFLYGFKFVGKRDGSLKPVTSQGSSLSSASSCAF